MPIDSSTKAQKFLLTQENAKTQPKQSQKDREKEPL